MEVNHILKGKKIPLWTNPTVGARLGEKVTFHVIGLGTAFHTFLEGAPLAGARYHSSTPPTSAHQPPASLLRPVRAWGPVNGTTDL